MRTQDYGLWVSTGPSRKSFRYPMEVEKFLDGNNHYVYFHGIHVGMFHVGINDRFARTRIIKANYWDAKGKDNKTLSVTYTDLPTKDFRVVVLWLWNVLFYQFKSKGLWNKCRLESVRLLAHECKAEDVKGVAEWFHTDQIKEHAPRAGPVLTTEESVTLLKEIENVRSNKSGVPSV